MNTAENFLKNNMSEGKPLEEGFDSLPHKEQQKVLKTLQERQKKPPTSSLNDGDDNGV